MPAYDFEEAFKDNKPAPAKETQVDVSNEITIEKFINLTHADKQNLFAGLVQKANLKTESSTTSVKNDWKESLRGLIKGESFLSKEKKEETAEERESKEIRTVLAGEFISFIKSDIEHSLSFQLTRNQFKVAMLFPAITLMAVSLLLSGPFLILSTFLFPFLLFLQISNSAQMKVFERNIWNTINSIPEEKLKQVLHAVMSNNVNDEIYSEDEIKETIDAYMYSNDSIIKSEAQFKIRENIRHLFMASKDILKQRMLKI